MTHYKPQYFVFVLLIAAAVLLAGCDLQAKAQAEETPPPPATAESPAVIAEGRLVPKESTWLGFERMGRAEEVLVTEGQAVKKGDVLVRLDGRESAEAAIQAAELELLDAQQTLDKLSEKAGLAGKNALTTMMEAQKTAVEAHQKLDDLDTNDYQQEIDDAWVSAQDLKQELDDAQEEFDKYKDLDEDNAERKDAADKLEAAQKDYDDALRDYERLKNDLDSARAAAAQADAAVEDARREYDNRKDGPDPDELALAQSRLDNAKAGQAASQAALEDLELIAPFDGEVTDVKVSAGEQVSPGQSLIQMADFSEWYIETTDLTEIDVVKIDSQEPVIVIPDALPETELTGHIDYISDTYSEKAGDVVYMARIRLDDTDPLLRWGMTVEVHFAKK